MNICTYMVMLTHFGSIKCMSQLWLQYNSRMGEFDCDKQLEQICFIKESHKKPCLKFKIVDFCRLQSRIMELVMSCIMVEINHHQVHRPSFNIIGTLNCSEIVDSIYMHTIKYVAVLLECV